MITGIIIILILAAIGISFLAAYFWKRAIEQQAELDSLQDSQIESPVSESPKKVDWEPDDYKDLSEGKYERFSDDDLDEVSEYLRPHQLREFGG